nr:WYL domain-containing protein [Actinomycetales bacterium]
MCVGTALPAAPLTPRREPHGSVGGVAENISAAERVLDLMIALINSPTRMTRNQIRRQVRGYRGDEAAFERTFARDKDLLRTLGIPLVTERDVVHEDDVGYRIDVEAYRVPEVSFTPQELGVLALASSVHQDATWRSLADTGTAKALGLGPATGEQAPPLRVQLREPEAAFDTILEAIESRRTIEFDYAARTSARARRTVEPWRLVARRHGWYLLGLDRDRGAARAYRLSRIEGRVQPAGEPGAFEPPAEIDPEQVFGNPPHLVRVRLALAPDRAALIRARGTLEGTLTLDGETQPRDVVVLEAPDEPALTEELAGYGADAVVLDPPELRDAVLARLRSAAEVADAS